MKKILHIIFVITILSSCTNQKTQKQKISQCDNVVSDNKLNVSLCLPNNNFAIERNKDHLILSAKKKDSTQLSNVIFMLKVNDFNEKLTSDWYLQEQLKEYQSNPEIQLETVNKSTQIINGRKFADLELVFSIKGNKIYSHSLFHFDGTMGYFLDANVLNEKISDRGKLEISSLYRTFKIL